MEQDNFCQETRQHVVKELTTWKGILKMLMIFGFSFIFFGVMGALSEHYSIASIILSVAFALSWIFLALVAGAATVCTIKHIKG